MFPSSLSPSRAGDFLTCPLLYRLRVIDKLPEPPSAAAIRGTLVHGALEDLFGLSPRDRTVDAAVAAFAARFADLRRSDPAAAATLCEGLTGFKDNDDTDENAEGDDDSVAQAVVAPARRLLETYFTLEDPGRIAPHAREMAVTTDLEDGFALRGFIDRVDKAPDGRIRLVDYKTGRSPGTGFESKAMFQMRFYALIWWRMTEQVPTRLQLMYLSDGQVISYDPHLDDLQATERKILAIRSAIERALDQGFQPSTSALCTYCAFHEYCPAQGGQMPQLPVI